MQSALERYEGRKAFEQDIKDHLTALSVAQEGKTIWIDPPRDLKAPPITLLIFAPDGSRVDEYFRGEAASHPQSRFASSFIYQSGFPKAEIPLLYIAIEKAFAANSIFLPSSDCFCPSKLGDSIEFSPRPAEQRFAKEFVHSRVFLRRFTGLPDGQPV
jgi:hypothetical protein